MKQAIPHYISLPLAFFALVIITIIMLFVVRQDDPRLADADKSYQNGEAASTIAARKQAFNQALQLYQSLEEEYHPNFGTGKLYYNIANTYFQLEEYPWAILNYLRAQTLMPREEKIALNLAIAQEKLTLNKNSPLSPFSKVFFFHAYLSLPERLQIFFGLSLLAFGFSSAFIWAKNRWIRYGMGLFLFLSGIFLLSLLYTHYLSPVQAVLVKTTDLYRDAGLQYAKVGEQPLPAGTQVEVLNSLPDGKWLKIVTPEGNPGFVPHEVIRLLDF